MTTVIVHDAIGAHVAHLPAGHVAGYTTGSGPVPWTAAQFLAHPGAVRIDQDPSASDPTADVLDIESGAATPASAAAWCKRARVSYNSATRPGQRKPAVYVNRSNMTAVANELTAAGISGVGIWLAAPGTPQATAEAMIERASGPFPVIAVQFAFGGAFDTSVFSAAWLQEVSVTQPKPPAKPPAKPPVPPGQWDDPDFWTWEQSVMVCGTGKDGKFHLFALEGAEWVKVR